MPILKDLFRQRTTAEWLDLLKGEVPCAPVNTVEEAFRDPQVAEDQMILEIPHPEFGIARQVASPIKISNSEIEHRRGPKLSEHTDEVLRDYLNMSPQEIEQLHRNGAL